MEPTWPINHVSRLAKLSDSLGFSNVWVPDGGPSPPYSDSVVTLAAVASNTNRIKFGSAILNFYTRNPAWIASSFLALSDLGSHGLKSAPQRAVLGIGVGSPYNVGMAGIKSRSGMIGDLREAVESIRELFQGKQVTVITDSFAIEGVKLSKATTPIPVYVGSGSPKGLRLAGEISDGVILTDRITSEIEESMKHVLLGASYASRSRKEIQVIDSVVVSLDENREKARRAARKTCAYLVAWIGEETAKSYDLDLDLKRKIAGFIDLGDEQSAAKFVDDKMLDLLTISGNVEDCVTKCEEHLLQDVDQIAFCEPFGPNVERAIRTIAKKVVPRFR